MGHDNEVVHQLGKWKFYKDRIQWNGITVIARWEKILVEIAIIVGGIGTGITALLELIKFFKCS